MNFLDGLVPEEEQEQSTFLPEGQRTREQEEALGVDIFGAPETEPSSEAPPLGSEEAEADIVASPPASASLDPIVAQAGELTFTKGIHAGDSVAWCYHHDRDYLEHTLRVSPNEKLKAAITTYLAAKEKA